MNPTVTDITRINRKKRTGQQLNEEERAALRTYYSKYTPRKKGIHLREAKAELWEAKALEGGVSFSRWVQHAVDSYLRGNQDEVRQLVEERQQLQDELAQTRRSMARFAEENGAMHARLESLERSLAEAVSALNRKGVH
jgi:cell fate (sporulation/competence/biofilm development) regulator YlbF (YheA/YmcA/DUF963 family)